MATDAQMAQRKKDLLAAEIAARRRSSEHLMGLLAGWTPDKKLIDPTFSGVPGQSEFLWGAPLDSQVTPGQKKTILDRLIQPPVDVPMVDMPPMAIGRDRPFPMERRVDVPVVNRGDLERLEPVTSRFMPSVPPPMRGREPTTPVYPAYTDAMAAFDQLVKAKAAEAERVDDPRDSNLALVAAARADVGEMQADIDKKLADRRAQAAGTAVPTALIPRAEPTQQQPTRPYWDSIESIYGPNVRARVGDARADEMEMDLFGPAVTPGAVTRAPTTDARSVAKAELSEDESFIKGMQRKKRILSAVSNIWGTRDNSSSYEAAALTKYKDFVNKRALQRVAQGGFPDTKEELLVAWTAAGGGLDGLYKLFSMGIIPDPKGFTSLYNHDTGDVWSGRIDSPEFVEHINSGDWHTVEKSKSLDSEVAKNRIEALKLSNTERDDLRTLLQKPIQRIHELEDSYKKVKITSKGDYIAEDLSSAKDAVKDTKLAEKSKEVMARGIRDIALINSYQRMIDPATVREGDVALQRSAAATTERLGILLKQIMDGTLLSQGQRDEMRSIADDFYKAQINSYFPAIMDARDFLVEKYKLSGVPTLTADMARLDFKGVVSETNFNRWEKNYKENLDHVTAMLETPEELTEEGGPAISAADYQALIEAAEEAGLSVEEYLELQERKNRAGG